MNVKITFSEELQIISRKFYFKLPYHAPEIIKCQPFDQKCDVWSLGLILYEMLTGKHLFHNSRTKGQLKIQMEELKESDLLKLLKQLDYRWIKILSLMLTYDKKKRPSFNQILQKWETLEKQIQTDVEKKYYGFSGINKELNGLRKNLQFLSPYLSSKIKNKQFSAQIKLLEEKSYKKLKIALNYLSFFAIKSDLISKIILQFTQNSYTRLKNVYKYILMFLSISCGISKLNKHIMELNQYIVKTPQGQIKTSEISQAHLHKWQCMISELKAIHNKSIKKYRGILQKQIVERIAKKYMDRQEERTILSKDSEILELIEGIKKGNMVMNYELYLKKYVELINGQKIYCNKQTLEIIGLRDIKTYMWIRLTGQLDYIFCDKNFMNEDYIRVKIQDIQNFSQKEKIQYINKYLNKRNPIN